MIAIGSLWLAIVLSAVLVFVASAVIWMVLPHHKSDFRALPDEAAAVGALRPQGLAPGIYNIPHVEDPSALSEPAVAERFENGPVGFLTVLPNGVPGMARSLVRMFLFYLVVSATVAYVLTRTLEPGAGYLAVFRIGATVAWMAYSFGTVQDAIWFGRPWSHVWKGMADGLVYGVLTGGVFGWQWPA